MILGKDFDGLRRRTPTKSIPDEEPVGIAAPRKPRPEEIDRYYRELVAEAAEAAQVRAARETSN